ncbi:MAG: hypothetical protein LBB86_05130 [Oscillospiraceae bacterium]|jgi:hypothetical protein|nr:hypothetical protein [Oscillospiraceae bacterium]
MRTKRIRISALAIILVGLSVITLAITLSRGAQLGVEGEDGLTAGRSDAARVAAGAVQLQTIHYQRCGHSVLRTVDSQPEWAGLTPDELTARLDMGWRVTDFAPDRITMSKNVMLFCPQHYVLMPDETGQICVWTNRYGDGMERVRDTSVTLADLPETQRELVRVGVAFDSESEADAYLVEQTSGR